MRSYSSAFGVATRMYCFSSGASPELKRRMSPSLRANTRMRLVAGVSDWARSRKRGEPVGRESVKPAGRSKPSRVSPTCSPNGVAHAGAAKTSSSARKASGLIAPPSFASPAGRDPHPQRVQPDEARGVGLIVGAFVVLEGGDRRVEQRFLRRAAGDQHRALVELDAHRAVDRPLRGVDQLLQEL